MMENINSVVNFTPMPNRLEGLPLSGQVKSLMDEMFQLKQDLSYILRFIESGLYRQQTQSAENENGRYVILSDGTLYCTKTISFSMAITKAWGTLYEGTSNISLGSFACPFTSVPILSVTPVLSGSNPSSFFVIPKLAPTAVSPGSYSVAASKSIALLSGSIHILAIGRWQ